jgi:sugar/nucleoside kinase (ribokinase family)
MSNLPLWIVGSIGIDNIETPRARRTDLLGGSVTYACAAASFFARTGAVGVVGSDFPASFLERYQRFGMDLGGLQTQPGATFRWSGVYEADFINRRTLDTQLGVFANFTPELPESFRDAPFVLLGNIGPALQAHVLDQVRGQPFVALDTMDLWIRIARPELEAVIRRANLVTLNDAEVRLLTGRHNLLECARAVLAMGPQYVVIKKGEHGALLCSAAGISLIPAFPVEQVEDPTGAGDCFAGAFMGFLAQTRAARMDDALLRRALLYGSVVASFGVESFSTERLERLEMSEIEERAQCLRQMVALS